MHFIFSPQPNKHIIYWILFKAWVFLTMATVTRIFCFCRIVLANRVSLAGSAAAIASGVALGGDHGSPNHPVRMLWIALFGGMYGAQMWNTFINGKF